MNIRKIAPHTYVVADERYENFLPALLAGPLLSLGRKAISGVISAGAKLLGGAAKGGLKAVTKTASVLGSAAKSAASAAMGGARNLLSSVMPSLSPAYEGGELEEEQEYASGEEEGEEYYEEDFGYEERSFGQDPIIHLNENEIYVSSPYFEAQTDAQEEQFLMDLAEATDALYDRMTTVYDSEASQQNEVDWVNQALNSIAVVEPDHRYAYFFKKLKKAVKKVVKKAAPLLKKLGPAVALIPGVGTLAAGAIGLVSKLASKPKAAAEQLVPSAAGLVSSLTESASSAVSSAIPEVASSVTSAVNQAAPSISQAVQTVSAAPAAVQAQLPSVPQFNAYGWPTSPYDPRAVMGPRYGPAPYDPYGQNFAERESYPDPFEAAQRSRSYGRMRRKASSRSAEYERRRAQLEREFEDFPEDEEVEFFDGETGESASVSLKAMNKALHAEAEAAVREALSGPAR